MDAEALETVTMVSALPNRLVLSRLRRALPDPTDRLRTPLARLELAGWGDGQPSSSTDARREEDGLPSPDEGVAEAVDLEAAARRSGLEPIRVSNCPPELIASLARKAVEEPLHSDRSTPAQVALVRPARLLRRVIELGERAEDLHVRPPEVAGARVLDLDDPAGTDGADDLDPGMVLAERLWRRLNLGCTLILEEAGAARSTSDAEGPPGGRVGRPLSDDPVRQAIARDHLPLLRAEASEVWHRVPSYLVVVELHGTTTTAAVDGLRRLLDEVRDAVFHVPDAPAGTGSLLRAEFGSDPRFLFDEARLPLGVPYVVHTSITVPLTTETVAELARRSLRRDVSVVRVLLPDEGGRPSHLSLTRAAALNHDSPERHPLEHASPAMHNDAVDLIAGDAGLEWVLPERVGLPHAADDGPPDILGPSAALSTDELAAIGRLQEQIAQEQRARQRAEHRLAVAAADLEQQIAAREQAEVKLSRRSVQASLRSANALGRARRRLQS